MIPFEPYARRLYWDEDEKMIAIGIASYMLIIFLPGAVVVGMTYMYDLRSGRFHG
jgi:hypothetical protein